MQVNTPELDTHTATALTTLGHLNSHHLFEVIDITFHHVNPQTPD